MAEARAMAKTRDFKETLAARVQNDLAFAQALLEWDSGSARRLFGQVDNPVSIFVRCTQQSRPYSLADSIKVISTAARTPAWRGQTKSRF